MAFFRQYILVSLGKKRLRLLIVIEEVIKKLFYVNK